MGHTRLGMEHIDAQLRPQEFDDQCQRLHRSGIDCIKAIPQCSCLLPPQKEGCSRST